MGTSLVERARNNFSIYSFVSIRFLPLLSGFSYSIFTNDRYPGLLKSKTGGQKAFYSHPSFIPSFGITPVFSLMETYTRPGYTYWTGCFTYIDGGVTSLKKTHF
jgi:hypothetical protein